MDRGEIIFFLAFVVLGMYILARLRDLAEKTRMNSIREEAIRELIRKESQKRRLDQLYGRDKEE